ncbi:MAG: tRNA epoxyqueuosine(34) reductase QueG [bacterium]|nr:tRNA epoxyqueuosine(34) reductase QueG [Gemmatimonadota bacterium]HIL89555.1 tRNA epoxyqueuosine(34) reductase QueG [Gemmatimonadota bacterium]
MRRESSKSMLVEELKAQAKSLGFSRVGIAAVNPSTHIDFYQSWIDAGMQGEMEYLAREESVRRRGDVEQTLPGARSVIVVTHDYLTEGLGSSPDDPAMAIVARYARGDDYHDIIKSKLLELLKWLTKRVPERVEGRVYVDTGPILERDLAQRAGLGWFGKNTMLIDPTTGSFFFLGLLLIDLELSADSPFLDDRCGTCRSCLDACPTGALLGRDAKGAPVMDARRCISYLTIELRSAIPVEFRSAIGNRIYGCDICQEVCPWNERFAEATGAPAYRASQDLDGPSLLGLAEILLSTDELGFRKTFKKSAIKRAKRSGLLRNICIALGNWGAPAAVTTLLRALSDMEPLVRGHAAWALGQIGSSSARSALSEKLTSEEDAWVRTEISAAIETQGSSSL